MYTGNFTKCLKYTLLFFLFVLRFSPLNSRKPFQPRIIGGHSAPEGKFLYIVSIQAGHTVRRHICGGSIVSEKYVLTAAHCMADLTFDRAFVRSPEEFTVAHPTGLSTSSWEVEKIIVHPLAKFEGTYCVHWNFALLRIFDKFPIGTAYLSKAILPFQDMTNNFLQMLIKGHVECVAAGWRNARPVKSGIVRTSLMEVSLPLIQANICEKAFHDACPTEYDDFDLDDQIEICTMSQKEDVCQADGGGPLECSGLLIGVTSWGKGCEYPRLPSIFANVIVAKTWIHSVVKDTTSKPICGPSLVIILSFIITTDYFI